MYGSIAFVVFAMLMIMNFISVTISSSKKQIGVLSALGVGKFDVLRIFAVEALLIAVVAFLLALPGIYGISGALNDTIYGGTDIEFMKVRYMVPLATLAIACAGCCLGSVIPIARLMRKKPVEIIKA